MKHKRILKNCLICRKEFNDFPSHIEKRKYCSRTCFNLAFSIFMTGNQYRKGKIPKNAWGKGEHAKEKHPNWKGGKAICNLCKSRSSLYKLKCGLCRKCLIPLRIGKLSAGWKGGICPTNKLLRSGQDYKEWRKSVFERDNYTCVVCGIRGGYIEADHIKPISVFPKLRVVLENGRTLCKSCHKKTDTYCGKARVYGTF